MDTVVTRCSKLAGHGNLMRAYWKLSVAEKICGFELGVKVRLERHRVWSLNGRRFVRALDPSVAEVQYESAVRLRLTLPGIVTGMDFQATVATLQPHCTRVISTKDREIAINYG